MENRQRAPLLYTLQIFYAKDAAQKCWHYFKQNINLLCTSCNTCMITKLLKMACVWLYLCVDHFCCKYMLFFLIYIACWIYWKSVKPFHCHLHGYIWTKHPFMSCPSCSFLLVCFYGFHLSSNQRLVCIITCKLKIR